MSEATPHQKERRVMSESQAKTLYMVMLDCPKDYEEATNRWIDGDHVPQRLSCAGFLCCERFQLTEVEPPGYSPRERWSKYLNVYEVESPEVFGSESSTNLSTRSWLESGNPRTRHMREQYGPLGRGEFRSSQRVLRTLWSLRPSPWTRKSSVTLSPPRSIFVVLRDFDAAHEAEINRHVDGEEVPEILSCAGFLRCERYQVVAGLNSTGGVTEKQPSYMDVYDLATPEVATSDAYWRYHNARSDQAKKLAASITVRGCGVYMQRPSPWAVVSVR